MTTRRIAAVLACAAGLAACGDDQQEIRAWMEQERAKAPPMKLAVAPPKKYDPFRYVPGPVDPFSPARLSLKGASGERGPKPDLQRRREPLEQFPLESIAMVGHLRDARGQFALLRVENTVYRATVGGYAGQNYGRITRVTEAEVVLREMVQDAAGDWVERDTSLRLQENTK